MLLSILSYHTADYHVLHIMTLLYEVCERSTKDL